MITGYCVRLGALSVLVLFLAGCGFNVQPRDLSSLTADADNDGFLDVPAPDGVTFDDTTNIHVRVVNEVGQQELAVLAARYGVSADLVSLANIQVDLTLLLDYGDGLTQTLHEVRTIEPFNIAVEAACPDVATATAVVSANLPVVGNQVIFDQDFPLQRDVDYACGEHVELSVALDENGDPVVDFDRSG